MVSLSLSLRVRLLPDVGGGRQTISTEGVVSSGIQTSRASARKAVVGMYLVGDVANQEKRVAKCQQQEEDFFWIRHQVIDGIRGECARN